MQSLPNEPKDVMKPAPQRGIYPRLEYSPSAVGGYPHTVDADSGTFVQYFRILRRRKGLLALGALLGAVAAFLITLPQTPVYRAQTLLEVENLNEDFLNMRNASPTLTTPGMQAPEYNIKTYTTVLQSRPVLERAMKDLKPDERSALMGDQTVTPSTSKISWRKALGLRQPLPAAPGEQAMEQVAS